MECTEQTGRHREAGLASVVIPDRSGALRLGPFEVVPDVPPHLFCTVCWLTDPAGAGPAVMVVNGLSVCYTHATCMQVAELPEWVRDLIRGRKQAAT